jgi:hypothetical protein
MSIIAENKNTKNLNLYRLARDLAASHSGRSTYTHASALMQCSLRQCEKCGKR